MSDKYRAGVTAAIAILIGVLANVLYAPQPGMAKVGAWVVTMTMVVVLCACIGKAIAHQWTGVLIDSRNRISLSRLQMFGWTLVVLSGLITAVASNLALSNNVLALSINIPDPLLVAMGIAATSAAATPALLTLKTNAAGASLVPSNPVPSHASWLDMFQGDEASDVAKPDLSKIQQFLISLALIGGYAVLFGDQLYDLAAGARFETFPSLDDKFIWLLGISHAGYLTYKAAPKPPAAPRAPAAGGSARPARAAAPSSAAGAPPVPMQSVRDARENPPDAQGT